jgi:hypothetical protein
MFTLSRSALVRLAGAPCTTPHFVEQIQLLLATDELLATDGEPGAREQDQLRGAPTHFFTMSLKLSER